MKKFVSIALALVLTLSLAVVAFAEVTVDLLDGSVATKTYNASATITNVYGTDKDYGAKVEWVDGTFTFGATQNWTYDAETKSWVENGDLASPSWGGEASVTITNWSNAAIDYVVSGSDNKVAITNAEDTLAAVTIANEPGATATVTPSATCVITPATSGLANITNADPEAWVTVTVTLNAADA